MVRLMGFALRDYQREAVEKTMAALTNHKKVGLILPTGAGKTELFIEVCNRFLRQTAGKSVLVLSHLSLLTEQTIARFALRSPEIRTGVLQASVRPYILSDVVVGTMQTSRNKKRAEYLTDRMIKKVGLIVVDEAHYMPTDSYQTIFGYHPEAKILGCTATPYSRNKLMTNQFDTISYSISLEYLIERGHLVRPRLIELNRQSDEVHDIMAQVVRVYKDKENGQGSIVFMKTKAQCRELRELFTSYGIPSEVIVADNQGEYRREALQKFKNGETKVLITVNVLTAGFDCPNVCSIFMPWAIGSVTTYLQRIGRGIRTCPEIGKRECRIYCFGSAPRISNGFYRRISNLALNAGGEIKEYETVTDTLEFNEWEMYEHKEKYVWNQNVANAVQSMKKSGFPNLSDILNHREFPPEFMGDIQTIINRMPIRAIAPQFRGKPTTPKQNYILSEHGFSQEAIKAIDKRDACLLVSMVRPPENGPCIMPSGRFKGYHASVLPHAYVSAIMKRYPNSSEAQAINAWKGKKHEGPNSTPATKSAAVSSN